MLAEGWKSGERQGGLKRGRGGGSCMLAVTVGKLCAAGPDKEKRNNEESYLSTAPNSSDDCKGMVVGILVDRVKFEGVKGVGGVDHRNKIISVHRNEMCGTDYTIKVDN